MNTPFFLLVALCFLASTTSAQRDPRLTDISCSQDSECGQGVCSSKNTCYCDELFLPVQGGDGTLHACAQSYGSRLGRAFTSGSGIWLASYLYFACVHLLLIFSTIISNRLKNKSKSWSISQLDPSFCFASLFIACLLRLINIACEMAINFGLIKDQHVRIIGNLSQVFFYEAEASVIFFWYASVQSRTKEQLAAILRKKYLYIFFAVLIAWWMIGTVGTSLAPLGKVHDGLRLVDPVGSFVIQASLIFGIFWYGLKIVKLTAISKTSRRIIRKVSIILVVLAVLLAFVLAFVLLVSFTYKLSTDTGYLAQLWFHWLTEMTIMSLMVLVFSGGDVKMFWKTIWWYISSDSSEESPLAKTSKKVHKVLQQESISSSSPTSSDDRPTTDCDIESSRASSSRNRESVSFKVSSIPSPSAGRIDVAEMSEAADNTPSDDSGVVVVEMETMSDAGSPRL